MSVRNIVEWPAQVLKQRCAEVETFDADLHTLVDDMRETMVTADGLGLAANQVGVSKRVFVMGIPEDEEGTKTEWFEVINPVITKKSGEQRFEEGCLSFPGVTEAVVRAETIELTYRDRDGNEVVRELDGIASVCAQHELDHLDGVTFLDRLSALKRRLALRAYTRERRARKDDERFEALGTIRR